MPGNADDVIALDPASFERRDLARRGLRVHLIEHDGARPKPAGIFGEHSRFCEVDYQHGETAVPCNERVKRVQFAHVY